MLLERLRLEKCTRVERRIEAVPEALIQRTRSREQPLLEQAGARVDVACHLGFAFVYRTHRVRDLETGVPQRADEAPDGNRRIGVGKGTRQQDKNVDIRVRKQLAATVTADGDQRARGRCANLVPNGANDLVDEPCVSRQQTQSLRVRREFLGKLGPPGS